MKSIAYFQQAINKDPKFARAYAGLALAEVILPEYTTSAGDTMVVKGSANARRALALDSTVAEAEFACGFADGYQLRFDDAEFHFVAGLRLDPSNAYGHMWRGTYLSSAGKLDEGIAEMRKAAALDPLSAVIGGNLAGALGYARKYEEAIAQGLKVLEVDSTHYVSTHDDLALAYVFTGRPQDALREQETAYRLAPETPGEAGTLVFMQAAAGHWAEAIRTKAEIVRKNTGNSADADLFKVELAFGDRAGALTILERAFAHRTYDTLTGSPGCDPVLDLVKTEPRYTALMRSAKIQVCPLTGRWPIGKPRA